VNVVRSEIPAVTHVDYSARLQTIDEQRNSRFHHLLKAFDRLTGCPVLVNTSFNVRGEPIVCTPEDAYRSFLATDMDALVLEDVVIIKEAVTGKKGLQDREAYLAQFQLD
jgi:carbamoyltransferase